MTKLKVDYWIGHQYDVLIEVPDEIFKKFHENGEDSLLQPYLPRPEVFIDWFDVIE